MDFALYRLRPRPVTHLFGIQFQSGLYALLSILNDRCRPRSGAIPFAFFSRRLRFLGCLEV